MHGSHATCIFFSVIMKIIRPKIACQSCYIVSVNDAVCMGQDDSSMDIDGPWQYERRFHLGFFALGMSKNSIFTTAKNSDQYPSMLLSGRTSISSFEVQFVYINDGVIFETIEEFSSFLKTGVSFKDFCQTITDYEGISNEAYRV